MTRLQRRVSFAASPSALFLTLMVLAANALGLLDSLEYWLYDQRADSLPASRTGAYLALVHLDIDDASVSPTALGRWPWPRGKLRRFWTKSRCPSQRGRPGHHVFRTPGKSACPVRRRKITIQTDDDDLIRTLHRCGNVVLAASFKVELGKAESDGPPEAIDWFTADLEMTRDAFARRLRDSGDSETSGKPFTDLMLRLRRRTMKGTNRARIGKSPGHRTTTRKSSSSKRGFSRRRPIAPRPSPRTIYSCNRRTRHFPFRRPFANHGPSSRAG